MPENFELYHSYVPFSIIFKAKYDIVYGKNVPNNWESYRIQHIIIYAFKPMYINIVIMINGRSYGFSLFTDSTIELIFSIVGFV